MIYGHLKDVIEQIRRYGRRQPAPWASRASWIHGDAGFGSMPPRMSAARDFSPAIAPRAAYSPRSTLALALRRRRFGYRRQHARQLAAGRDDYCDIKRRSFFGFRAPKKPAHAGRLCLRRRSLEFVVIRRSAGYWSRHLTFARLTAFN